MDFFLSNLRPSQPKMINRLEYIQHSRISTEISFFSGTVWTWHSVDAELVSVQSHSRIHSSVFETYLRIIILYESLA